MATPGTYHNPTQESRDIEDEKIRQAYEEGHDADIDLPINVDLEKGAQSNAVSTHSNAPTLAEKGDAAEEGQEENDPNIVDWDGPDDPQNPMNWTEKKKWSNIATLSLVTLITYAKPCHIL